MTFSSNMKTMGCTLVTVLTELPLQNYTY